MKTLCSKIAIFLFFLCCANISVADITIESEILNEDIKIFFINDFDLTQSGNSPLLFRFIITNDTSVTKRVSLNLRVFFINSDEGDVELSSGTTGFFDLSPSQPLFINNQDLYSNTGDYKFVDYSMNEDAADDIINTILSTGKLPSGTYQFLVTVTEEITGETSDYMSAPMTFEIYNPTTLDLIAPGEPAGGYELMEIYTPLPLFQWESDASSFRLKVCEKLPANNSPDDVMSNDPRLETTVEASTFQYPLTGAFPLYPGTTYFWQVVAVTQSSSGPVEMESEIWGFKIVDMSKGLSSAEQVQIMNTLKLLLPARLAELLFNEFGELAGFSPTGVVFKDGKTISLKELYAFLEKITAGKIKITGHSIE